MLERLLVFQSWPEYLLVCAVLCAAEVVYLTFGFGAGLLAVGTLALLLPDLLQDVVVLLLLTNFPAEVFVVARSRKAISWRGVAALCIGVAVGVPLGTILLRYGDPKIVLVLLGIFLVLTGLGFLVLPATAHVRWPRWTVAPIGLISGVLTGAYGTGGPPLILYYLLGGTRKEAFRGNLMAVFLVSGVVKLPAYVATGLLGAARLVSALAVLPAILLGAFVGHHLHIGIPEARFRKGVSVFLALIGVLLLARVG